MSSSASRTSAGADCPAKAGQRGYGNTVFVDAIFGSKDGRAEDFDRPFRTVRQGIKAASKLAKKRGGLVQVQIRPGTYREGRIRLQASLSVVGSGRLSTVVFGYYDTSALKSGEEATVLEHDVTNFEAPAVLAGGQGSVSFRRMRLTSIQRDISRASQEAVKQTAGTHTFTECEVKTLSSGGPDVVTFRLLGGAQDVERGSQTLQQEAGNSIPSETVQLSRSSQGVLSALVGDVRVPDGLSALLTARPGKTAKLHLTVEGQEICLRLKAGRTLALDWLGDGYYFRQVPRPTLVWGQLQSIYGVETGGQLKSRGNTSLLQADWPAKLVNNHHLSGSSSSAGNMDENFTSQTPQNDTLTGPEAIVSGAGTFVFLVAETVRSIRFNFQPTGGARFFLAVQFTIPTIPEGGIEIFGNLPLSINGGQPVSGARISEAGRFAIDNSEDPNLFNLRTIALSEVGTAFVRAEADVGLPISGPYTVNGADVNATLLFAGGNLVTLPTIAPRNTFPTPPQVTTGFQVRLKVVKASQSAITLTSSSPISNSKPIGPGETVSATAGFDPATGQRSWIIVRVEPNLPPGEAQVSQPVVNGADKLDWMIDAAGSTARVHVDSVTQHGTAQAKVRRIPAGTENQYTVQKIGTQGQHLIGGSEIHAQRGIISGDYVVQLTDRSLLLSGGNVVTLPPITLESGQPASGSVLPGTLYFLQVFVFGDAPATLTSATQIINSQPINPGQSVTVIAYADQAANNPFWVASNPE